MMGVGGRAICPPSRVVEECPAQKNIFYPEINYAEPNDYLRILIGCVWGNDGRWGGLVALQSLPLLKRTLATPISNRVSSFLGFYDESFVTKCPGMEKKKQHIVPTLFFT
jgi:hypothetical protein